eukprot:TRINITY_DN1144_c0_g1_i1.p1 TRINITY_DN1144_c0_g1~~TRINITY_DN1144_c0_g1_i1.p1  ORF type:complete len:247 (+),score=76.05 TRINITY_DN1144_c0_g1_i1:207-947(+)
MLKRSSKSTTEITTKDRLLKAVAKGNPNKVRKILKKIDKEALGCDVAGFNALTYAAMQRRPDLIDLMLNAKIDVNIKDGQGRTCIYVSSLVGDSGTVKVLLKNYDADPEIRAENGEAPYEGACTNKHQNVLEILGQYYGKKLLNAAKDNQTSKVKGLLKIPGINVNFSDLTGWTPLMYAMKNQNETITKSLSLSGADGTIKNRMGVSALKMAENIGNMLLIKVYNDNREIWMSEQNDDENNNNNND